MSAPSHAIAKAVAATAGAMLFIAGVFFYFFRKYALARYPKRHKFVASFRRESGVNHEDIKKVGGNVKGLIVEENGVDVLYMMDTESKQLITGFTNSRFNPSFEDVEEEKRINVVVQRSKISKPQMIPLACESQGLIGHEDQVKPSSKACTLPPPLPPLVQPSPMIHEKKTQPPPPPPPHPPPPPPTPPPPPPPAPPRKEIPKAAPPGPPPLPKVSGFISSLKPPPVPEGKPNSKSTKEGAVGESSREKGAGQTRLKALHWDKVVANVEHSTVWDQINDGSFRYIILNVNPHSYLTSYCA